MQCYLFFCKITIVFILWTYNEASYWLRNIADKFKTPETSMKFYDMI